MADDPTKPPSPPQSPEELRAAAREWFAEARETSAKDEAEVKSWQDGMNEWGWCLGMSAWERVKWSVKQDFYWRDKVRRNQGKPPRRFWESD